MTSAAIAVVVIAALYLAVPAVAGLDETWRLSRSGNARWLGLSLVLELGSYAGYVLLRRDLEREGEQLRHRDDERPR